MENPEEKKEEKKEIELTTASFTSSNLPKKGVRRIQRIAKGEVVLKEIMAEDLCDKFDKFELLCDEAERAVEQYNEAKSEENSKNMMVSRYEAERSRMDLWQSIHERYGSWTKSIGVRDGYTLVALDEKSHRKTIEREFKNFLRRHLGGEGPSSSFSMED